MASGFSITRLKAKRQRTSFKSARKFISTQNFVPSKLSIRYEDRGRTLFRFSYFSFFFSYLKVITFNAPAFFVSVKCKNGLRQRNGIQKRQAVTQAKGIPKMVAERKTRVQVVLEKWPSSLVAVSTRRVEKCLQENIKTKRLYI